MRRLVSGIFSLMVFVTPLHATDTQVDDPTPRVELGAKVYAASCVLCHGSQGAGDGVLPKRIKDYPNTSLLVPRLSKRQHEILRVTAYGALDKNVSDYMPPFGNALNWTELESVAQFVQLLRTDPKAASALIPKDLDKDEPNKKAGGEIFAERCVLCHGPYGEGDGRMAKLLKTPPPADLTASRLPENHMEEIIRKGGEGVGRSKHMPPWGDQLSDQEIRSVILHLLSIRD